LDRRTIKDAENSLAELKALAETAGSEVLEGLIQRRDKPDPATYIGSGKVIELKQVVMSPELTQLCAMASYHRRNFASWKIS
jgi:50S ribosomal subunit-associated GTPase HflX